MKVSVILASFNRPSLLRQAVDSLSEQSHPDVELVLIDESDIFDAFRVASTFRGRLVYRHHQVSPEERRKVNRLSVNLNEGLSLASGDLVSFLCDDDYYFPDWLSRASRFFSEHPDVSAAYGILNYTRSMEKLFMPPWAEVRYPGRVVEDPFGVLDHNQVIHRRFDPPFRWDEDPSKVTGSDAYYFRRVASSHPFHPIPVPAAVKRIHPKNLQASRAQYEAGMKGVRE